VPLPISRTAAVRSSVAKKNSPRKYIHHCSADPLSICLDQKSPMTFLLQSMFIF
jgi:hypothetical protein